MANTPDIGTYQPFPEPEHRIKLAAGEIAVKIGTTYYPTREGLEKLGEAMGYAFDYEPGPSEHDIYMRCTVRRGETEIGGATAVYPRTAVNAVRSAQAAALRRALHLHAPDVLAEAARIVNEAEK